MVQQVSQSAGAPDFSNRALRQTLASTANCAYTHANDINTALSSGSSQGVQLSSTDANLTKYEETYLHEFIS